MEKAKRKFNKARLYKRIEHEMKGMTPDQAITIHTGILMLYKILKHEREETYGMGKRMEDIQDYALITLNEMQRRGYL